MTSLQMFGPYQAVRMIGRGGFGEVYEVIDGRDGQHHALKVLRRSAGRKAAKRAFLEATLLRRMNHINVVRFIDSGTTDGGQVWLVTELLQGQTLREAMLNCGALPLERALNLVRQICSGLAESHAIGAVHRDVKPENVFLMRNDLVKIIDFGIAKHEGVDFQTTQKIGTPLYIAPDYLMADNREDTADPRWDIYSVAMILYEMILGRHPFANERGMYPENGAQIVTMQLTKRIPPLIEVIPDFPESASACIAKGVEKDPKCRWSSIREFDEALCRCQWPGNRALLPDDLKIDAPPRDQAVPAQGAGINEAAPAPDVVRQGQPRRRTSTDVMDPATLEQLSLSEIAAHLKKPAPSAATTPLPGGYDQASTKQAAPRTASSGAAAPVARLLPARDSPPQTTDPSNLTPKPLKQQAPARVAPGLLKRIPTVWYVAFIIWVVLVLLVTIYFVRFR